MGMLSILKLLKHLPVFYKDHVQLLSRIEALEQQYEAFGTVLAEINQIAREARTIGNRVEKRTQRHPENGQDDPFGPSPGPTRQDVVDWWNRVPTGTILPSDVAKQLGGNVS